MRMSDIVSHLGLAIYPIIGLLLFGGVFAGVLVQVLGRKRQPELDRAAMLPLVDDTAVIHTHATASPRAVGFGMEARS